MMINLDLSATAFYEGGSLVQIDLRSPDDLRRGLSGRNHHAEYYLSLSRSPEQRYIKKLNKRQIGRMMTYTQYQNDEYLQLYIVIFLVLSAKKYLNK
ncbi:unnamed protein product [Rhizophagus irregularis]|nr:unnamed protein product [Rhizophagus irregularis]